MISGVIGPGRIAEAQEEASQQAAALQPVCQTLEPRSHQLSDGLNMVKHGLSEAKKTGQITGDPAYHPYIILTIPNKMTDVK